MVDTVNKIQQKTKKEKRKKIMREIVRDRQLYFMLIPFVIYYLLFYYMPMYGLQIAFKDYKPFVGITDSKWVGFEHFINFLTGPYAWRVIKNTLLINVRVLAINFPLTIVFALLINEITHKKLKSLVQTVTYMPHFISAVVVAGLVISMLSPTAGVVNLIIQKLGGEKIYFLSKPEYFRTIFQLTGLWQNIGYNTIIYTSAICAIDQSLYEAAECDGAGRLRKMFHITLPGIASTIIIMFIMKVGSILAVGSDMILLLYQPITYETADVISTFVYRNGIEGGDYSFASAVGLFNSIVGMLMVFITNAISKKVSETSLW